MLLGIFCILYCKLWPTGPICTYLIYNYLLTTLWLNQVAEEIWVCENQAVTRWEGDIMDFKKHLKMKAGLSD